MAKSKEYDREKDPNATENSEVTDEQQNEAVEANTSETDATDAASGDAAEEEIVDAPSDDEDDDGSDDESDESIGSVVVVTAGNKTSVPIGEAVAQRNLEYVVRQGFRGATIVKGQKGGVRVVRGEETFMVDDPTAFLLEPGDTCYIAKIHSNG